MFREGVRDLMHAGRIQGFTRVLGPPEGWDKVVRGACGSLVIRDEDTVAGHGMTSAWFPTPEELKRVLAGAPIYLTVVGEVHPPVSVGVGLVPGESVG
jgi:hypothetical protein